MRAQSEARELVVVDRVAVLPETGIVIPGLFAPDAPTGKRVFEFFTAHIRNRHTREAYARAAAEFSAWCERRGIGHLRAVEPFHIAAYVEEVPAGRAALAWDTRLRQPEGQNREGRNEKIGRGRFAFKEDFQRNGKRD